MTDEKKKRIWNLIKNDILIFGGVFAVAVCAYFIFGVNCPTKLILKIDCPFCGMTRAHLAALRLDFKAAFGYHPFFFLGIPYLLLINHDELFKGRLKIPYRICIGIMTALFLVRFFLQFI